MERKKEDDHQQDISMQLSLEKDLVKGISSWRRPNYMIAKS